MDTIVTKSLCVQPSGIGPVVNGTAGFVNSLDFPTVANAVRIGCALLSPSFLKIAKRSIGKHTLVHYVLFVQMI